MLVFDSIVPPILYNKAPDWFHIHLEGGVDRFRYMLDWSVSRVDELSGCSFMPVGRSI